MDGTLSKRGALARIALVVAVVAVVAVAALIAVAALPANKAYAETYSGSCGTNVTWTLDTDTGVLDIEGTGKMTDYYAISSAPWHSYREAAKSLVIGEGVTSIGSFNFSNCSSLASVSIPEGVTSVGFGAFFGCASFTSVSIPSSVTSIGSYAFCHCASLSSFTVAPGNTTYRTFGRELISADGELIAYANASGSEYDIPSSVTAIGETAFEGCTSLASVSIPEGVTSIGNDAFDDCTSLASVGIPSSVTSIGRFAFWYCDALADVYYAGAEENRAGISISDGNDPLEDATWHYNSAVPLMATASTTAVPLGTTGKLACWVSGLGTATASYQWQYSANGGFTWKAATATGAKTAVLSAKVTEARAGYLYRCVVTASDGRKATTDAIQFDTMDPMTAVATTEAVALGKTGTLSCSVEGLGDATASYQWQWRKVGGSWSNATANDSAKTADFSVAVTEARASYEWRCKVTASDGRVAYTDAIAFEVFDPITATASTDAVAAVGDTGELACSVEGLGEATASYQWQYSTNGGSTWKTATAAGADTAVLSAAVTETRLGYVYRCKVTASDGRTAVTDPIAFEVAATPLTASAFAVSTSAIGETGKLVCDLDGLGDASVTYQWYYRTSSTGDWAKATADGNKAAVFKAKVTATRLGYEYKCVATASDGRTATTDPIRFEVG